MSDLYPGFAKIHYVSNDHQHIQILPLQPYEGIDGFWWTSEKASETGQRFADSMADYADVLKLFLSTSGSVVDAELWTLASIGADPIFREVVSLSVAGTASGAPANFGQAVMTYRTELGGLYRWYCMEPNVVEDTKISPPYTGVANALALLEYLIGDTSPVCGRDGGWLVGSIRFITKENDALRKKYFLNS